MTESTVLDWIELTITGIEILAIVIIAVAFVEATFQYLYRRFVKRAAGDLYHDYRLRIGRAILLGLEILIAADVIRTVTLDRTIQSIVVLGLLVAVRIVLSWSLLVEIESRWPWQPKEKENLEDKKEKEE
jgi:uncharacterized membrane protein